MLINYLKTEKPEKAEHGERGRYYVSIGEIAIAVKLNIKPYMESIVAIIKMGITSKKRSEFFSEALRCLSMMAIAIGGALRPYMNEIIPDLFNGGLSNDLTECIQTLRLHVPAVATDAQEMLLNHIALSLGYRPFSESASKNAQTPQKRQTGHQSAQAIGKVQSIEFSSASSIEEDLNTSVALTLTVLRAFDFTTNTNVKSFDSYLEQFLRVSIMGYLDNSSVMVRRESARTIAILVGKVCIDVLFCFV
jgi:FKBP12-rapamycin complex-associated protein